MEDKINIPDGCIWLIRNNPLPLMLHSDCADNHECRWDRNGCSFQLKVDGRWMESRVNKWGAAYFSNILKPTPAEPDLNIQFIGRHKHFLTRTEFAADAQLILDLVESKVKPLEEFLNTRIDNTFLAIQQLRNELTGEEGNEIRLLQMRQRNG